MNKKRCSKCKELLPHSKFYKNDTHKDGCGSFCKQCTKINAAISKTKRKTLSCNPKYRDLTPQQLCEAGICPECKRPNLIENPTGFICGWCRTEYDKNGVLKVEV